MKKTLLLLTLAGCMGSNTLFLDNVTATRQADDRVATTVSVECDGDCHRELPFCVTVTWQLAGTDDTATACQSGEPGETQPTAVVVTSNAAVPTATNGLVSLTDSTGRLLPRGESALGGVEDTSDQLSAP